MGKNVFKITPVQDKARQKELCELCGASFNEEYFAYVMFDTVTNEVMGMSQFEISSGTGYISDLRSHPSLDDFEAMFILGRQTMNFIDLCGLHTASAALNAADERLIRAIGFKPSEDGYFSDMTGFFDGHCDGGKK